MSKRVAQLVGMFVMAHNDGAVQREYDLYEQLVNIAEGWGAANDKEAEDARRALDALDRDGFLQDY